MAPAPMITVLMATKDRPDLLHRAVASLQAQTYQAWELWLMDTGHASPTRRYIHQLKDARIQLVSAAHSNQAQALNLGLKRACGRYIVFHDDDDVSHPHRLQRCWEMLESSAADGVIPAYAILQPADRLEFVPANYLPKLVMLRRSCLEALGGFRPFFLVHEDKDLQLRWQDKQYNILHCPEVLYFYRNHLGKRVSEQAPHYGGSYALAAEFSAYRRRNHQPDPIDSGASLDDILRQFSLLPQPKRDQHLYWDFFNSAKYGLQRRVRMGQSHGLTNDYADIANILQICGYAGNIARIIWYLRFSLWFLKWRERMRFKRKSGMPLNVYLEQTAAS